MNRYFQAAKPSTERHIFSVPIPTSNSEKVAEPTPLTDVTKPGFFSTKFSPGAGFYVLDYNGPDIPWTKVVDSNKPGQLNLNNRFLFCFARWFVIIAL